MTSLEDLDGVGPSRATLLRRSGFETIDDIGRASRTELTAISGIGDATARSMIESAAELISETRELSYEESKTRERLTRQRSSDGDAVVVERDRLEEEEIARREEEETARREAEATRRETATSRRCRPSSSAALESAIDEARERARPVSSEAAGVRGALLQRVLEAEIDEDGRVGSTPLTGHDVDVDVTVTFRPSESFGPWLRRALEEGTLPDGVDERDLELVNQLEPHLLEWIDADPEHAAQFVLDPASALAEIAPEKTRRLRAILADEQVSAQPPVSMRSLSVAVEEGHR
ncbi:helix-hairpin-helix domain-containing protein [Natronobiforma cellulositropha]|uniref:helix-hairpin-helix domain-containing protein n=1 Tax=Natronobiforma cellulositropha TaxID=1679076 RepID=UPI0021D5CA67|nr:helix-hairpin-helix domain-containing protein [Natronobiforma cellulositropha]